MVVRLQLIRVVAYLVEQLAARGITHIFGVDGANIEDLFDAAYFQPQLTTVLAKHEFSAAAMADAYARTGSRFGVVAATSGGGCLNLVPGLGESLASRVPVLALVGQAPMSADGLELVAITQDVGQAHEQLDAQYEGTDLTVAFNPDYLMNGLDVTPGDEVSIETVDTLKPALLRSLETTDFLYLLMPVRVS